MRDLARRRVHFVGIGGAGMSAIARVLIERGGRVSGSDIKPSPATDLLSSLGAEVRIGHDGANVGDAESVVASSAIRPGNPEIVGARRLGLEVLGRGEALARVLEGCRAMVVAGTHGKTTTTSMIVSILSRTTLDPTYLVGGELNDAGTNARAGGGDLAVAESDESDGSFLLLAPHIAIVTNVEADHLDHWKTSDALEQAFSMFISSTDPQGAVVVPSSDARLLTVARAGAARVASFGEGGDVRAREVDPAVDGARFVLAARGEEARVAMRLPGRHNVDNALAAAAACLEVGVSLEDVVEGLAAFTGVARRWQVRGRARGVTVIDEYAHHPTEVRASLATARPGSWSRVVAVFQPHRYSRTAALVDDFGTSFGDADAIVVTDVYGAGEEPVPGVTGKLVADSVSEALPGRPVAYLPRRSELVGYLESTLRPGDVLLTLGAGDVTTVGQELLDRLEGDA